MSDQHRKAARSSGEEPHAWGRDPASSGNGQDDGRGQFPADHRAGIQVVVAPPLAKLVDRNRPVRVAGKHIPAARIEQALKAQLEAGLVGRESR